MKKIKLLLFGLVILLTITGPAYATPTLDQDSPYINAIFNADSSGLTWQQEVTVGIAGNLVGVVLYRGVYQDPGTGSLNFFLNIGPVWQSDPNNFQSIITLPTINAWNYIDVSSAGLYFNPGDHFVIGIQGVNEGTWVGGSGPPPQYSDPVYLNGSGAGYTDWRIGFHTYVDEGGAIVPEPATMLLIGSGLLGLLGFRRKFKK
jgi:hypothetical protein